MNFFMHPQVAKNISPDVNNNTNSLNQVPFYVILEFKILMSVRWTKEK